MSDTAWREYNQAITRDDVFRVIVWAGGMAGEVGRSALADRAEELGLTALGAHLRRTPAHAGARLTPDAPRSAPAHHGWGRRGHLPDVSTPAAGSDSRPGPD